MTTKEKVEVSTTVVKEVSRKILRIRISGRKRYSLRRILPFLRKGRRIRERRNKNIEFNKKKKILEKKGQVEKKVTRREEKEKEQ